MDCLGVAVTDTITNRFYCRRRRRQHWSYRRWCSWWFMHFFIVISKWRIMALSLWHPVARNLQTKWMRARETRFFFVIRFILFLYVLFYQLLLLCQPVNASDRSVKVRKKRNIINDEVKFIKKRTRKIPERNRIDEKVFRFALRRRENRVWWGRRWVIEQILRLNFRTKGTYNKL